MQCLKNASCSSGFCNDGVCSLEPGLDDPCLPSTCGKGLICHPQLQRCKIDGYKPPKKCRKSSECSGDELCQFFDCVPLKGLGDVCGPDNCQDGLACSPQAKRCVLRCHSEAHCGPDEKCYPLIGHKYGVCESLKKLHPVFTDKPNPNKMMRDLSGIRLRKNISLAFDYSANVWRALAIIGIVIAALIIVGLPIYYFISRKKRAATLNSPDFSSSASPPPNMYSNQYPPVVDTMTPQDSTTRMAYPSIPDYDVPPSSPPAYHDIQYAETNQGHGQSYDSDRDLRSKS